MKKKNQLMKMAYPFLLPRRLRTSSTLFQVSSTRKRKSQKKVIRTILAQSAWMTCKLVRWWKLCLVHISSTRRASTSGWNRSWNAHCAKRESVWIPSHEQTIVYSRQCPFIKHYEPLQFWEGRWSRLECVKHLNQNLSGESQ